MEEKILSTMRAQSWQRAKGELRAVLETYWDSHVRFREMSDAIQDFVKMVEDRGLAE